MKLSKIVRAVHSIGNVDDFKTYYLHLQDKSCPCGPTIDEAHRDYATIMKPKYLV